MNKLTSQQRDLATDIFASTVSSVIEDNRDASPADANTAMIACMDSAIHIAIGFTNRLDEFSLPSKAAPIVDEEGRTDRESGQVTPKAKGIIKKA